MSPEGFPKQRVPSLSQCRQRLLFATATAAAATPAPSLPSKPKPRGPSPAVASKPAAYPAVRGVPSRGPKPAATVPKPMAVRGPMVPPARGPPVIPGRGIIHGCCLRHILYGNPPPTSQCGCVAFHAVCRSLQIVIPAVFLQKPPFLPMLSWKGLEMDG